MYKAIVGKETFIIETAEAGMTINGEPVALDIARMGEGYFHILAGNRGFRAEIVEKDEKGKQITVKVNGKMVSVILKDRFDTLLEEMGIQANAGSRVNHVRAPMPGLIVDLRVKDGDEVKTGDTLLILEAMKMENAIKAPGDAIVKSVKVRKGEGVEKNQVLIEF